MTVIKPSQPRRLSTPRARRPRIGAASQEEAEEALQSRMLPAEEEAVVKEEEVEEEEDDDEEEEEEEEAGEDETGWDEEETGVEGAAEAPYVSQSPDLWGDERNCFEGELEGRED